MRKKQTRQEKIVRVLKLKKIGTQEELLKALKQVGEKITQATLSRDMQELGVIRIRDNNGKSYYRVKEIRSGLVTFKELTYKFSHYVTKIVSTGSFILIKTIPGEAPGAGWIIDELEIKEILGTIAGDDTILVVIDKPSHVTRILRLFKEAKNGTY